MLRLLLHHLRHSTIIRSLQDPGPGPLEDESGQAAKDALLIRLKCQPVELASHEHSLMIGKENAAELKARSARGYNHPFGSFQLLDPVADEVIVPGFHKAG